MLPYYLFCYLQCVIVCRAVFLSAVTSVDGWCINSQASASTIGWMGVNTDSLLVVVMVGDVGHPTETDVRSGSGVEVECADGPATPLMLSSVGGDLAFINRPERKCDVHVSLYDILTIYFLTPTKHSTML